MNTADDLLRRAEECLRHAEYPNDYREEESDELRNDIHKYLDAPRDEDEPTAWMFPDDIERFQTGETFAQAFSVKCGSPTQGTTLPLYLHPPTKTAPMKPITDEEILDACPHQHGHFVSDFAKGVRFAERHHGIGGGDE